MILSWYTLEKQREEEKLILQHVADWTIFLMMIFAFTAVLVPAPVENKVRRLQDMAYRKHGVIF